MRIEKFLIGLLLFPLILVILLVFVPLVILYGVIMLLLRKPIHFSYASHPFFSGQRQESQDEEVIDVEVIQSENVGDRNVSSERSLQ